ncbi:hypothetical protein [Actinomycetospora aeridis]|uniref:Sulfotransferase family protein n=1 Tax=Actinomycetospora aeridis TaxID=3129231 RepID=A0ABU8NBY1_9PSEU
MTGPARAALRRGAGVARTLLHAADDRVAGRTRLHFLHIGKTGGTAIKAAFGRSDVVTATHRLVLHDHGFGLDDVPPGERAVFVLRDPVSRFVSAFNSRRRQGRPRYDAPWTPQEAAAFAAFPTADSLARALDDPRRRGAAQDAMRSIRHVRDPLTSFLGPPDTLPLDRIALVGSVVDLDAFARELTRLLGAPPVTLPTDPVAAHRAPPDSDTALSDRGRENVRRWYADDVAVIEALSPSGVSEPRTSDAGRGGRRRSRRRS